DAGEHLGDRFTSPGRAGERIGESFDAFLRLELDGLAGELDALGKDLRARLADQLGWCVGAGLAARVGSRVPWARASEGPRFERGPRGQHEACWIAVHTFARDVVGVWYPRAWSRRLDLWAQAARACNRWWPFERCCVVSERPSVISWDEAGRLHGEAGPA